jgi:hypothetical protein
VSDQQMPPNKPSPFDYQKWLHEMARQDAYRAHDKISELGDSINKSAMDSAQTALRTSVLINGGAAVSVLAFIGGLVGHGLKISELGDVAGTLVWFAGGAAAATLGLLLSYLTNFCYASALQTAQRKFEHPYIDDTSASRSWRCFGIAFHILALLVGLASLIAFVWGVVAIRNAIGHIV